MAKNSYHVVHNKYGGWDVRKSGSKKASFHASSKQEAVARGRSISRNQSSELVIHGLNGRIQRSDSHGNDPCPPKDRK